MPPKTNNKIEFSSGSLYIKDLDEEFKVFNGEATYEDEYAEDDKPLVRLSAEPIEFTINDATFIRDWTTVKCKDCGCDIPVTQYYALTFGTKGWTCPGCKFWGVVTHARGGGKRSME